MEQLLQRSQELENRIFEILALDEYLPIQPTLQCDAAIDLCLISIEHGRALRTLVAQGLNTPAFCLMRPQFEALVRATWAMWAAKEVDIQRLQAPLTAMTEGQAAKLPNLSEMLRKIQGQAPAGLVSQLTDFKQLSVPALNSFVHGGIHALTRQGAGYPEVLVDRVVRQSNALMTMAGMLLATLGDADEASVAMRGIQRPYADCLPELLVP